MRTPLVLSAIAILGASLRAASSDWSEYLGGGDRNHYSALSQINRDNVAALRPAWTYHTGDVGEMQCSPLVVAGVLYGVSTRDRVFALDAATGAARWTFLDPTAADQTNNCRGVSYWSDGLRARILCTIGPWLYSLDAVTGRPDPRFGDAGRVSLKTGLGGSGQGKWVVSTTPGTVFENLIVMPTRVSEDTDAARGDIQAFDLRTGKLAWVFHTIPFPGEPGYETWPKEAYRNRDVGSANCWAGMAVDHERGILYVPTGSAAPDFWGGGRTGQNLYANCLLALDARTGRLRWHYQFVHHDIWDRDCPAPPNLVTVRRGGRAIPAVAQVTKAGLIFVFDRLTGQSLFPIEERAVPASPLAGETPWPTQPWPLLPEPFSRQTVSDTDVTAWAHNREGLLAELRQARKGWFQPFSTDETVLVPGFDGGAEWGGAAADPDGILYINANEVAWMASLSPTGSGSAPGGPGQRLYGQFCAGCHGADRAGHPASGYPDLRGVGARLKRADLVALIASGRKMMPGFTVLLPDDRETLATFLLGGPAADEAGAAGGPADAPATPYRFNGYTKFLDDEGYPATPPPWGTLTAVDLNTGRRRWRVTLGEFKELAARGIPPTGTENYGGPVATAGNLVFIAATKDGHFRAFDRLTGRQLWQTELPAPGFATPATYAVAGRQYVAVCCGGEKLGTIASDCVVAFALPAEPANGALPPR